MKKLYILLILIFSINSSKAQVTLDLAWDSATVAPLATVSVDLTINNSGFQNVNTIKGSVHFDASKFTFVSASAFGIPNFTNTNMDVTSASTGTITFDWQHPISLGVTALYGTKVFTLTFLAIGNAGDFTQITMDNNPVASNYNGYWIGNNVAYTKNVGYISIQGSSPCTPPDANFTATANPGQSYAFNNTTTGTQPISYLWTFGDGDTSTAVNPSHTYSGNMTYDVCLIASNACGLDSFCSQIECDPPLAQFSFQKMGLDVNFSDLSSSVDALTYNWDFGDGGTSMSPSPSHGYAAPGTYTATLIVENACSMDTFFQTVDVCTTELNNITSTIDTATNSVLFDSDGPASGLYFWDFGDGNQSNAVSPSHTYTTTGSFTVTLHVVDPDCNDTASITQGIVLDVKDIIVEKYHVYPNPAIQYFQLEGIRPHEILSLQIYDMLGRQVMSWQNMVMPSTYDVSGLISGEYLIWIQDVEGMQYSSRLSKY